ncbi:uncharacterized protein LOC110460165 [Mizuhopecten yessoensis]|uniref:Uncharacterized protein n=1 Tax=Mizuhopecten yessoensis TaxID=6573 RepID=A0A210R363_MIZYE|nr:uncharacterized protein LOC110460165 [Mizuhopecten yessoensis]OWF55427.1 hypothetical protein KP79_PYT10460 [Mizuhopecten yessoensis]
MTEAEVIDDKGRAAALSRNYGLDVDMADSALAASSVASRDHQKKCLHIYREFIKNMNCHLKDEKEVREDLNRLRKEKITNMKYSLYRSAGEDVFSSAKQKRQKMMENMAIVSPLIFDDTRMNTPWGLDNIIDEDLLRPQTAPAHKVTGSEERNGPVEDTEGRPQTVSNTNYRPLDFLDDITMELEINQRHIGGSEAPLSPTTHGPIEFAPQPSPIKTERVRFATPNLSGDKSEDKAGSDEETDGFVDPKTERTRARKITINAVSFAKLSIGEIMAKLKHKDGKFKIKPININYTPNEVDAVFIAKDPTKEKMALVRQSTTCNSSTIATDLKVNNRIAIMKSLMGVKVKKKTVSEIFDNGRDRKTRHFRIVLKNPKCRGIIPEPAANEVSKEEDENSVPIHVSITPIIPKKPNLKHTPGSNDFLANQRSTPSYIRDPNTRAGRVPTIHASSDTDAAFIRTSSFGSRLGYDHARNDSRMSVASSVSQDPLQRSLNSRNMQYNGRTHHGADVVDRSVSVMSGRESVIFEGTDADMTEMIRMLVEGEGRGGTGKQSGNNRPASRASVATSVAGSHFGRRMKTPSRRMTTPSSMLSDSEMSYGGVNRPQSVNKRTTKQMVKDLIQQDREYHENMDNMRRRMASTGRRSSVTIRKL